MEKIEVRVGREYPNGNIPGISKVGGQILCRPIMESVDPRVQYSKLIGGELKPAEFDPTTGQETVFEHPQHPHF
ncbi:hypothetical protein A2867_00550 [Candidatus Daviesbacteria bacterium RIFCSPHIGHO2_01_FULL_40_11]|uniref:Uncharacterized protein n=1 Tax=Candidatus Daviesbacteria bacterium RIFCSPHIGHO2_01_FULL_40_11 TaxID=1797762 RepID=A0A1F5JFH7_9BACT|nr:MAG: hypothetical protein A2867_00550 [Candidatus Daviesbacteria bacterium RIFCSPHIGHO2_01_FULL_40_11]